LILLIHRTILCCKNKGGIQYKITTMRLIISIASHNF
jgi:hypothetical protein